jgi:hypothetical protein
VPRQLVLARGEPRLGDTALLKIVGHRQSADCFVDAQGVMYLTDNSAGLYILQFEGV